MPTLYPVPVYGQKYGFILVEAGGHATILSATIVDGDTTHAPTGNAVFDALALKSDTTHNHTGVYVPVSGAFLDAFGGNPVHYDGTTSSIDCNNLAIGTKSLVTVGGGNTNTPSKAGVAFWYIETINSFTGATTKIQRAWAHDAPNATAYRLLQGGSWTSWTFNADDSAVVHTTGNETVAGIKTFTGGPIVSGGTGLSVNTTVDGGGTNGIRLWNSADAGWAIYMAQAGAGKSMSGGTAVSSLSGRSGHHIRYRTTDTAAVGHIWENSSEVCAMSLDGDTGTLVTKGRQIANAPATFAPTSTPLTSAQRADGAFGGGYTMVNGSLVGGMWTQSDASGSIVFGIGTSTGLTAIARFSVSVEEKFVLVGRQWLQHSTMAPGTWYSTSANAKKWFIGVRDDTTIGLYNANIPGWSFIFTDDGRHSIKNANSTTLTTQPRVFVQAGDPGAAAADGDLWFW